MNSYISFVLLCFREGVQVQWEIHVGNVNKRGIVRV